jgi:fumarylacetoacetate (FAA) hydrolase
MRVATLRDGSRDGTLVVVDRAGETFAPAHDVARNLQAALDDWERTEPLLRARAAELEQALGARHPLAGRVFSAPLPRAYEWIDGSAYLNHIRLVRRARGADLPEGLEVDPLVYQGGSGVLLGPADPLVRPGGAAGLDFEGEVAVVLGDVPRGVSAAEAMGAVRLVMLANDVTYRDLVPAELKKGFGFFVSKPSTSFSPFAVTPDELGDRLRDGRVHLRLVCTYNGSVVGDLETGPEMHFSFADLVAHAARTRSLTAGTILGSGTVSNADPARGVSCLVERRTRETLEHGAPRTPYMSPGDVIRIEAFDPEPREQGERGPPRSVFGAIEQRVVAA